VRSKSKFAPDRFSRFGIYLLQTNKQTPRQAKFIYRRKKLENLNNFSIKIRPELKIENFLLQFCEFSVIFYSIFKKIWISIKTIYIHIFAFLNF